MYCPSCGKENTAEQKFCRACGYTLPIIAQTAGDQTIKTKQSNRALEFIQGGQKAWQNPVGYALLLIMIGILIVLLANKLTTSQSISDIGTLVSLVGVFVIFLKGIVLVAVPSKQLPRMEAAPRLEARGNPPPALHGAEPVSVTENTTRQLEAVRESAKEAPRSTNSIV